MTPINSRTKGHDFERWVAKWFRGLFPKAKVTRGQQAHSAEEVPDVLVSSRPWLWIECKRPARAAIYAYWEQAVEACGSKIPIVVLRANHKPPLVLLSLPHWGWILKVLGRAKHAYHTITER